MQNTEIPGSNTVARFNPRPAGVHVEGWACHNVSNTGIFLSTFPAVWSVTRVAEWRELILVIQTDGPLGELMLWDNLTLLGSTILRVTW